jgi:hypothetical protein
MPRLRHAEFNRQSERLDARPRAITNWSNAFEVATHQEEMPPIWCHRLEIPLASTYAAGAAVLMATLADQTTLTWPDEFPRKIERAEKPEGT